MNIYILQKCLNYNAHEIQSEREIGNIDYEKYRFQNEKSHVSSTTGIIIA